MVAIKSNETRVVSTNPSKILDLKTLVGSTNPSRIY